MTVKEAIEKFCKEKNKEGLIKVAEKAIASNQEVALIYSHFAPEDCREWAEEVIQGWQTEDEGEVVEEGKTFSASKMSVGDEIKTKSGLEGTVVRVKGGKGGDMVVIRVEGKTLPVEVAIDDVTSHKKKK